MSLKLLPYLLVIALCLGIYLFVDGLQEKNAELVTINQTLDGDRQALTRELEDAKALSLDNLDQIKRLTKQAAQEQQLSKSMAEQVNKENTNLSQRIANLLQETKKDVKDNCSFSPMPDNVISMLFDTTNTSADSDHKDSAGTDSATSKPDSN
jgi:selenocysteine lyase/cysteine desulfurase